MTQKPISSPGQTKGSEHKFTAENPGYGVAYYPWLKTDILASSNADLNAIDEQGRAALKTAIEAEFLEALNTGLPKEEQNAQRARLKALTDALTAEPGHRGHARRNSGKSLLRSRWPAWRCPLFTNE